MLAINRAIITVNSLILIISGSPRKNGNTDFICSVLKSEIEHLGETPRVIRIYDYNINPCVSCRQCVKKNSCIIHDDMDYLSAILLKSDGIVIVSPVFFDNIPSKLKAFIDRTWCMRGKLRDKIGGVVVVGRRYGHAVAISTLISFMLKHEMILGMRGIVVFGFEKGEAQFDVDGINDVKKLARRIIDLIKKIKG